ncbi:MAG: caspase family protein, partial [Planctomycetaceae bacterium]|nr:caspase family protein [Planctomycetaceae bacterium]
SDGADDEAARRKRLWLAGGAFAASFLLCAVLLFLPDGSSRNAATDSRIRYGTVQAVYADQNRLKVGGLEDGIPEEFDLGRRPKIFFRNTQEHILLREMQEGDRVEVEVTRNDEGEPEVVQVMVSRPVTSLGRIRSINVDDSRIEVAVEQGETRDDLSLRVPESSVLMLNSADRRIGLSDLREGDRVEVTHLHEAGGRVGRVVNELTVSRLTERVGLVSRIDPARRRMTVQFGPRSTGTSLSLPIAEDSTITMHSPDSADASEGSRLSPADISEGDRVRFSYDTEFHRITITRDAQHISGMVQSIDLPRRELQLSLSTGERQEFRLPEAAERSGDVTLGDSVIRLADLRQYDTVELTAGESSNGPATISSLFATRPPRPDRWAVVIANDQFADRFITPSRRAAEDAGAVHDTLRSRYAVSDSRLLYLKNRSKSEIQKAMTDLLQHVRSQTQVVVYVTTPAYVDSEQHTWLATRDFNWDRMSETA